MEKNRRFIVILLLVLSISLTASNRIDTLYFTSELKYKTLVEEMIIRTNYIFKDYKIVCLYSEHKVKAHFNIKLQLILAKEFHAYVDEGEDEEIAVGQAMGLGLIVLAIYCNDPGAVLAHELGHNFGWNHWNDKTNIPFTKEYLMHSNSNGIKIHPYHLEWLNTEKEDFFDGYKKSVIEIYNELMEKEEAEREAKRQSKIRLY